MSTIRAARTSTGPPTDLPTSVVGLLDADGDGGVDLVVIGPDGQVDRVLVEGSPGGDTPEEGGPYGPAGFDVLPDGRVVYEMCCEPAAGDIRIVDPATGENADLGFGRHPAVSPDGSRVAVSVFREVAEIHVFDVTAGPEVGGPLLAGGEPVVVQELDRDVRGLAWAPDGSRVAIATSRMGSEGETDPEVEVVDLATGGRTPVPGALDAAFLADGRLLVTADGEADGAEWPQLVATSLAVVDPATGGADHPLGGMRIIDLDGTADGRWVLVVGADGSVRAVSTADGAVGATILTVPGLLAAG